MEDKWGYTSDVFVTTKREVARNTEACATHLEQYYNHRWELDLHEHGVTRWVFPSPAGTSHHMHVSFKFYEFEQVALFIQFVPNEQHLEDARYTVYWDLNTVLRPLHAMDNAIDVHLSSRGEEHGYGVYITYNFPDQDKIYAIINATRRILGFVGNAMLVLDF